MPLILLRRARTYLLSLAIAYLIAVGSRSSAQGVPQTQPGTFEFAQDRLPVSSLNGPWRFRLGDNNVWSDPTFDDSTWSLVNPAGGRPDEPNGQPGYSGSAWYRARINVPSGVPPLSLEIPGTRANYQVFADGKLIASAGDMPPHAHAFYLPSQAAPLPLVPSIHAYTVTLAIRFWVWPGWAYAPTLGTVGGLRIGDTQRIQRDMDLESDHSAGNNFALILLALLEALATLAALALYIARRSEREYLWFALFLMISVIEWADLIYPSVQPISVLSIHIASDLVIVILTLTQIAFYYCLLNARRGWLFWVATVAAPLPLITAVADVCLSAQQSRVSNRLAIAINILSILPCYIWIVQLVVRRAIEGFPDARLLLFPVVFSKIVGLSSDFIYAVTAAGWYHGSSDWVDHTISHPFDVGLETIGEMFFLLAMLAILIYRFTRTQQHEENYERERSAARIVQQLIVPDAFPHLPGYVVSSVYKPASEVSGDFFQVIPLGSSGSTLLAIGDVSGKGLPAALMVSLAIGTLNTYAETLFSPAEILSGLNRRLHGRSSGGFTTCLILRVDPDGTLTFANAGHLSPYSNSEEILVQSGLPLGLLAEAVYEETTHGLAPGDFVTLLTDGVLEARNAAGELFGFRRTQAISSSPASEIALTAQNFGQDDDITVLQLLRLTE